MQFSITAVSIVLLAPLALAQSSTITAAPSASGSSNSTAGRCPDGRPSITAGNPVRTVCCPGDFVQFSTNGAMQEACHLHCTQTTSACSQVTVPLSASDYSQQAYGTLVPAATAGVNGSAGSNNNGGSNGGSSNGQSGSGGSTKNTAPMKTAAPLLVALAGLAMI